MRTENNQIRLLINLLILLLVLLVWDTKSQAQYIIDWSKSHLDTRIDYKGWDYVNCRAIITSNYDFIVVYNEEHRGAVVNYLNFDGSKWSASLNSDKFIHYPAGRPDLSHEDTRIDYIANDGSHCSATINGNVFSIKNTTTNQTYISKNIYFLTWNNRHTTAALNKPNFIFWRGTVENPVDTTKSLKYLDPRGGKWTATLLPDGSFNHTDVKGKSHIDPSIIYLNYDLSIWGAFLDSEKKHFKHAPGRIAPAPPPPPPSIPPLPSGAKQFRGIFLNEINGVINFRIVTELGVCTNDIGSIEARKVIGKYKSGTCYNTGQVRDIYLFYYK